MKAFKNSGFTFIEIIVTLAVSAVVIVTVVIVLSGTGASQNEAMATAQIGVYNRLMLEMLTSDVAWQISIQHGLQSGSNPANMDCIGSSIIPCTATGKPADQPITNQPFALFDPGGQIVYDGTSPTQGLTSQGALCNNYVSDPKNGSDDCPFHYDLTWSADCQPNNCVNPQIEVNGTFHYNPSPRTKVRLALDTRRFDISRYFIAPAVCSQNFQGFLMPGTQTFIVPTYKRMLVVEIFGGGGGGGGVGPVPGQAGGDSSFNSSVVAHGAPGGTQGTWFFWLGQPFGLTPGGTAIGGDINISGGSTNGESGGSAPSTGLQTALPTTPCTQILIGGAGGPGSLGNKFLGGDGAPGKNLGGGGAGAWAALGAWWTADAWGFTATGGGGGAYSSKVYQVGDLAVSSSIPVVVGAGGLGGPGLPTTLMPGPYFGGNGSNGAVLIRWE